MKRNAKRMRTGANKALSVLLSAALLLSMSFPTVAVAQAAAGNQQAGSAQSEETGNASGSDALAAADEQIASADEGNGIKAANEAVAEEANGKAAVKSLTADNLGDATRANDISVIVTREGGFAEGDSLTVAEITDEDEFDKATSGLAAALDGCLVEDALTCFVLGGVNGAGKMAVEISGEWARGLEGYSLYHETSSGWAEAGYDAADGKIAFETGELGAFALVKTAKAEESVQTADADATAFAVYSETDFSLSFYKRAAVPSAGEMFNGKAATAVYTGIETDTYSSGTQPWKAYSNSIQSAEIVDGGIRPVSTAWWFCNCSKMTGVEGLGKLDTGAVMTMHSMFRGCTSLTALDGISGWSTGSVTSTSGMFYGCTSLAKLDGISGWSTGAVKDMEGMFDSCSSLASLDLSGWDTESVTQMTCMFYGCSSLTSLDLSGWDTRSVIWMNFMFYGCSALASLDLSGWNTSNVTNMSYMFDGCSQLQQVTLGANWRWAGTDGYLPTPSSTYITGADGNWYNSAGAACAPSAIPGNVADTYYAAKSLVPTAFAVYSETDFSLSFYKRAGVPSAGDTFNGKAATAVYTGIETDTYRYDTQPWRGYQGIIQSAKIVDGGITPVSTACWFCNCSEMTGVEGLDKLDTGAVTTNAMFAGCTSLAALNGISGWSTGAVKIMTGMFDGCTSLTSLDLSGWDTGSVTSMDYMFNGCSALTTLDLSGWDTRSVTSMDCMFFDCSSLAKLDGVSGWSTGAVEVMEGMFFGCSALASLDLSSFNTSKVTYMNSMFEACLTLTSLDLSGWDTSKVISMGYMFNNCNKLQQVTLGANWKWVDTDGYLPTPSSTYITGADGNWHNSAGAAYAPSAIPGNVADTYYASSDLVPKTAFAVYSDTDKSLSFYKRAGVPSAGGTFNGKAATAVYTGIEADTYSFYTQPWVDYRGSIQSAEVVDEGIRPLSTAWWFCNCSKMTSVAGLGKLDTGAVTTMYHMFDGCSSLTSLDLSGWDTRSVTSMGYMFCDCSALAKLDGISGWSIGAVEKMQGMFYGCSSLTSLDLSGWGTGSVTSMGAMFGNCTSLAALDSISGWNTGAVEDMDGVFYGCSALTSLDLSGWNTGAVKVMTGMFYGCSSLTSLDLSGWETGNVTDMWALFNGCSSLASLDLSSLDTGGVTATDGMFDGCSKLQQVTLGAKWKWVGTGGYLPTPSSTYITGADGNWYNSAGAAYAPSAIPGNVADTYYASSDLVPKTAFAVYSDTDKSLSFYKRAGVPSVGGTFNGKAATAVYTGIETDMYSSDQPWEGYRDSIQFTEIVDEGIRPLSTACWFRECTNMTSAVGLDKLDTGAVTTMYSMFFGCSSLTSLDLSGWDTGAVTLMSGMFFDCYKLAALDLSGWDTGAVVSMGGMFGNCASLATLDGISGWNTGAVKDMDGVFDSCSSLTSLDLSGWDTESVTRMTYMFNGCSSLTSLDLSGWDTGAVTNMRLMFYGCSSLASLDGIAGWNTGAVEDMAGMFFGCSSLTSLDLSGWDTGAVASMSGMFGGCTRLAKLVLGANTSLSGMSDSSEITSCKWLKGAEADQNVVEGSYLLTANRDIEAGATETFQKAVFFDANDGTGAAPTARSLYDLGWTYSAANVPDAVRGGYDFCGWYTAGSGGTKLTDGDALTPTTYYAQWTKSLHSLTVTNEVVGAKIDKHKEFSITVSLEGDGVPTEVLYEKTGGGASASGSIPTVDGKVSFTLKADERIVLKGLPDGTAYAVSQAAEEDYETTVAGGAGTLTADATVAVTNRYLVSASLPQTGSAGLALLFGLACVAGLGGLYRRRRMMG